MKNLKLLSNIFRKQEIVNEEHEVILETIDGQLQTAVEDVDLMKLELVLTSATGDWLDDWGSWFSVPRLQFEADINYRARILKITKQPKNTIPALISAIKDGLGRPDANVFVYEPHTDIFRFNVSEFSGNDKMQDAAYSRYAVIDIYIDAPLPPNVIDIVDNIRAAGIRVYFTHVAQLGGGTIIRMYSEVEPKYEHYLETQMMTKNTHLHIIGSTKFGDSENLMSGRKTSFFNSWVDNELGKIRMGRTLLHSRNTSLQLELLRMTFDKLHDDYFNAVSYEREKELGKVVMIDEIVVSVDTLKTTNILAIPTPDWYADSEIDETVHGLYYNLDIYANSTTPFNAYLGKTVSQLYLRKYDTLVTSNLKGTAYTHAFAGSMFPLSTFDGESLKDIDLGITFKQSTYSAGVQSITTSV